MVESWKERGGGETRIRERRTKSEWGEEGKGNKVMKWMEEEQACTTVLSM